MSTDISLTDLDDALRKITLAVTIETPTTGVYPLLIQAPFDFEIESLAYVLSNGSTTGGSEVGVTFQVEINDGTATDVTFTGSVTSHNADDTTVESISATGTNTGDSGDIIQLNVTSIVSTGGTPENLSVQLTLERTDM